jgi:hypothetical protein
VFWQNDNGSNYKYSGQESPLWENDIKLRPEVFSHENVGMVGKSGLLLKRREIKIPLEEVQSHIAFTF